MRTGMPPEAYEKALAFFDQWAKEFIEYASAYKDLVPDALRIVPAGLPEIEDYSQAMLNPELRWDLLLTYVARYRRAQPPSGWSTDRRVNFTDYVRNDLRWLREKENIRIVQVIIRTGIVPT